jgi:hypothetical protein
MIESLVGLLVMVAVTTFMASVVKLGSVVLEPKGTLTGSQQTLQKSVITQYSKSVKSILSLAEIEKEVIKEVSILMCELPRDSSGIRQAGCR